MTQTDFEKHVFDLIGEQKPFQPSVHYSVYGDYAEFFISDEEYYGERVDRFVTVYRGMQSDEIVGSVIKDVSLLLKDIMAKYPGFCIEIHERRVHLSHVFLAKIWSEDVKKNQLPTRIYQKLVEVVKENKLDQIELTEIY